jgi:hypothetical protein
MNYRNDKLIKSACYQNARISTKLNLEKVIKTKPHNFNLNRTANPHLIDAKLSKLKCYRVCQKLHFKISTS